MEKPLTGKYFVGVHFPTSEKSYYFSTEETELKLGDLVVVETVNGIEIATVSTAVFDQSQYKNGLALKPILRKADNVDITNHEINLRNAKRALEIAAREINNLGLPMNLVSAYYNLDGSKVTICYTSTEKRVDFRELLHVLAPQLGARLELFQMMARDKAKYIGGIGICGLPLCCSTFLSKFDSINIHMAKNQMLAINNAKLTGPCGKYLCCLSYEDELYSVEKAKFPPFGTVINTPDGEYQVDGINILSQTVRLAKADRSDYKTYPLEDVKAMQSGRYVKREEKKDNEEELPSFDFSPKANSGRDASYGGMHPSKFDKGNYNHVAQDENNEKNRDNRNKGKNRFHNKNRNNQQSQDQRPNNKDQNGQRNQGQSQNQNQNGNNGNGRHHHHHHHHRPNNGHNQGNKQ